MTDSQNITSLRGFCLGVSTHTQENEAMRSSGRKVDEIPLREAALAAFYKRRAKLISEVEQIDATIANMRCN